MIYFSICLQQEDNRQPYNCFEVSPTPSAWENGALNTPMLSRNQNNHTLIQEEKHIPQIKPLLENEINSVPG